MASYNRVIMIGNLTRDPEYRQLASGQGVCRLSLASNRQFKNRQSDSMVQEVCYVDIDVWGAQAESCRQYLEKGRPILVEGRLKYDTWQDQNGQTRSKHSIVADKITFLGTKGGASAEEEAPKDAEPEADTFQLNANNPVERDLMQQLEKAKAKIKGSTIAGGSTNHAIAQPGYAKASLGESTKADASSAEFVDQPPFADDLPF